MIKQTVFLPCRPEAAADLSLRSLMYLRTQCRNEGLKIKIHKSTKPEHLYYEKKKKLKCTRYVIRTQLVQLASWRKWGPRCGHPREQINKILSAQNGVRVSLGTAGLQLFPQQSHCSGEFSASYPKSGVGDKLWKKPCLTLERFPPTESSAPWVGPINLVSCLIFTFWHGKNYYYISFFERKTTSLSRPLSEAGDLGGGDSAKAHGERFSPEHAHKHLDRAWLEFICLTPSPYPAKKEEGVMLWTPA